jgi:hypothetical protein
MIIFFFFNQTGIILFANERNGVSAWSYHPDRQFVSDRRFDFYLHARAGVCDDEDNSTRTKNTRTTVIRERIIPSAAYTAKVCRCSRAKLFYITVPWSISIMVKL